MAILFHDLGGLWRSETCLVQNYQNVEHSGVLVNAERNRNTISVCMWKMHVGVLEDMFILVNLYVLSQVLKILC